MLEYAYSPRRELSQFLISRKAVDEDVGMSISHVLDQTTVEDTSDVVVRNDGPAPHDGLNLDSACDRQYASAFPQ